MHLMIESNVCVIQKLTAVLCYPDLNLVRNVIHNCCFNRSPLLNYPHDQDSCSVGEFHGLAELGLTLSQLCAEIAWPCFVFPWHKIVCFLLVPDFLSDSTLIISSWAPSIMYSAISASEKKQLFCLQCFMNEVHKGLDRGGSYSLYNLIFAC